MDRMILKAIIEKFSGGPVGVDTIAVAVSEEVDTITDVYEPYLIKSGFVSQAPLEGVWLQKTPILTWE